MGNMGFKDISVKRDINDKYYKLITFEKKNNKLSVYYDKELMETLPGDAALYNDDDFYNIRRDLANNVVHYEGDKLGEFNYDKRKFDIYLDEDAFNKWCADEADIEAAETGCDRELGYDPMDFQLSHMDRFDYLKYVGKEVNPNNIILPRGLKDNKYCLFNGKALPEACAEYNRNHRPLPNVGKDFGSDSQYD